MLAPLPMLPGLERRRPPGLLWRACDLLARVAVCCTVAGVSGTGVRSVATVIFDGTAGTRRFILSHGALEPLAD